MFLLESARRISIIRVLHTLKATLYGTWIGETIFPVYMGGHQSDFG